MPLFEAKVCFCDGNVGFYILEAESLIAAHIQTQEKIDELNRRIREKLPEADGGEYATINEIGRCYKSFLTNQEIDKLVDEAEYTEEEE